MRGWVIALGLCLVLSVPPRVGEARPYTVDDMLAQEGFGDVRVDPTGSYAVVERRGAYDTAASFESQNRNPAGSTRLLLVDLQRDAKARAVMDQPEGYGYLAGAWSPDGRRLAVFRLAKGGSEFGVATPESGEVTWLGVTPGTALRGRNLAWLTNETLVVLIHPNGEAPWELRYGSESARRLPSRWSAVAAGGTSSTMLGSGAHLQSNGLPAPVHLLRIDLRAGRRDTLAEGRFTDLELSPDGRRLALLETGSRIQPGPQRTPQGAWGTATEITRLAVLDLGDGSLTRPCEDCDLLNTLLSWSPSGRQLAVYARTPDIAWPDGGLRVYRPEHRGLLALDRERVAPVFGYRPERLETGWLGEDLLVRGRARSGGDRADWWQVSEGGAKNLTHALPVEPDAAVTLDGTLRVFAAGQVWRVNASATAQALGTTPLHRVASRYVKPEQRLTYVMPSKPEALILHTPDGGLLLSDGRKLGLGIAPRSTVVGFSAPLKGLLVLSTAASGEAALEWRRTGQTTTLVASVNQRLGDVDLPRVVPIHHSGPAGQPLTSWLYLPVRTPSSPPPLIVRPYLGDNYRIEPPPKPAPLDFVIDPKVLVGQGYAVLLPSLPLAMTEREPLAGIADRVLGIVDAAAAQAPGAFDPTQLALWGHSYGGYTTLGIVSQSDRFKAAIAMNAPIDLISHYGVFQPSLRVTPEDGIWPSWGAGFFENSQGRLGAPPWRDAARYIRNSPLFAAESIRTPVLLITSDQDHVSTGQSEEMFSALYRLGRDAVLVTYWGEGHVVSSPGNVRDLYSRTFGWLDGYLATTR